MKASFSVAIVIAIAASFFSVASALAQSTSINAGSLGSAGDGTHTSGVTLGLSGAIAAGGDTAVGYAAGERTTVPFNLALNPPASSAFTIELWVLPTAGDNDDTPLSNRQAAGNRSGWTFFQRTENLGWNFRMYNGSGTAFGWDLTGGTSTLNAWNHVVATWNGTAAVLYVNGVLADNTNDPALNGVYNPNTAATAPVLSIGANFDGGSPSTASIDDVAFYSSVLTPAQIANHYALASSPTAGAYRSQIIADGAVEYLSNIPEPGSAALIGATATVLLAGRRRRF